VTCGDKLAEIIQFAGLGLTKNIVCQGLKFAVSQYPQDTKIWFWIPNCE
jgi:hypothetical protein